MSIQNIRNMWNKKSDIWEAMELHPDYNWASTHKRDLMFFCGSANAHEQSKVPTANSKGSGKTGFMHSLARAFTGHLCDKYPFLMYWLI